MINLNYLIIYGLLSIATILLMVYLIYIFIFVKEKRYVLKEGWKVGEKDGNIIISNIKTKEIYTPNESMAFILKLIDNKKGMSPDMIKIHLVRTYQVTVSEVESILADILSDLSAKGIIKEIDIRYYKRKKAR